MPRRYFRYGKHKCVDSLLSDGNIRIGTLSDFRNEEHKDGITDKMEGRKTVSHEIQNAIFGPGSVFSDR